MALHNPSALMVAAIPQLAGPASAAGPAPGPADAQTWARVLSGIEALAVGGAEPDLAGLQQQADTAQSLGPALEPGEGLQDLLMRLEMLLDWLQSQSPAVKSAAPTDAPGTAPVLADAVLDPELDREEIILRLLQALGLSAEGAAPEAPEQWDPLGWMLGLAERIQQVRAEQQNRPDRSLEAGLAEDSLRSASATLDDWLYLLLQNLKVDQGEASDRLPRRELNAPRLTAMQDLGAPADLDQRRALLSALQSRADRLNWMAAEPAPRPAASPLLGRVGTDLPAVGSAALAQPNERLSLASDFAALARDAGMLGSRSFNLPSAAAAELLPDQRDLAAALVRADAESLRPSGPATARDLAPLLGGLAGQQPQSASAELRAAAEQSMERVVWMAARQTGVSEARLQLQPAHLGKLDIRLELNGREASVNMTVYHSAVREALEAMLPRLREQLEAQGLQLGNASVFDSGADTGSEQQGERAATAQHEADSAADRPGDAKLPVAPVRHGDGLLDTYA